jgi:RNA 3'-terminal phosphate cyclase (ATP)
MIEADGALFSGSGAIVRQSVAYSALTGEPVHIINARQRRRKPGLRRQHVCAVNAIGELVSAEIDGCLEGSRELTFRPAARQMRDSYRWDIGSAGSTTMLALAVLPVLAFSARKASVELIGGVFQDFAPSFFHLKHAVLPLLRSMGIQADLEMRQPGYVPTGGGVLTLTVAPTSACPQPIVQLEQRRVERVWGIALASKLKERAVAERMAASATEELLAAGYRPTFDVVNEEAAAQRGAALALFADCNDGVRLGADRAGALRRSAEAIGRYAARHLLEDLRTGATLDRHAADQVIPFAAMADGVSRFRIPSRTGHVDSGAWLARLFLGADVTVDDDVMSIRGVGYLPAMQGPP